MENKSPELPTLQESRHEVTNPRQPLIKRFTKALQTIIHKGTELMGVEDNKTPLDQIDKHSVSYAILTLGNPLQERFNQDKYANGFSCPEVMIEMGYLAPDKRRLFDKYPEEWQATIRSLRNLEDDSVLAKIGEDDGLPLYTVINKEELDNLAKNHLVRLLNPVKDSQN